MTIFQKELIGTIWTVAGISDASRDLIKFLPFLIVDENHIFHADGSLTSNNDSTMFNPTGYTQIK